MENNKWYKFSLIADLLERLNGVPPQFGKTVLQKMIFILQEVYNVPCGYKFSLYSYGPYCSEIPKDLDFVTALCGTEACRINSGFGGDTISPGGTCKDIKGFGKAFLDKHDAKIQEAVQDFGAFNVSDLELRSTIIYCCKEMGGVHGDSSAEKVVSAVYEIKPKFTHDEIETTVNSMIEQYVINS